MVKVKICGITNKEDALMVSQLGADAVGAVVDVPVKAPRKITIKKAREIFSSVPVFVSTVAVIMPETIEDVERIVNCAKPGIIQLQGYESPGFVSEIKHKFPSLKIIKVVHIKSGEPGECFNEQKIDEILNEIKDYENAVENDTGLFLKVHKSNYSVVGFSSEVSLEELVELGAKYHIRVMEDLGSGTFVDFSKYQMISKCFLLLLHSKAFHQFRR